MDEYPVLIQPIDYPLEEEKLFRCYNCGSNLFRALEEWGLIDEEYAEKECLPRIASIDIDFYCAVCGKENQGFSRVPQNKIIYKFDAKEDAEIYGWFLDDPNLISIVPGLKKYVDDAVKKYNDKNYKKVKDEGKMGKVFCNVCEQLVPEKMASGFPETDPKEWVCANCMMEK